MGLTLNAQPASFDRPIGQYTPGGLGAAVSEFAVWNYFTDERYLPGRFYLEGAKYPQARTHLVNVVAKAVIDQTGRVDHLGSAYVTLEPRMRPGAVVLDILTDSGQWERSRMKSQCGRGHRLSIGSAGNCRQLRFSGDLVFDCSADNGLRIDAVQVVELVDTTRLTEPLYPQWTHTLSLRLPTWGWWR